MDFCRYSKSGPKNGKYFQKVGKLKVVPHVTVRGMRVPKSVGDVKDFPKKNQFLTNQFSDFNLFYVEHCQ